MGQSSYQQERDTRARLLSRLNYTKYLNIVWRAFKPLHVAISYFTIYVIPWELFKQAAVVA